MSMQAPLEVGLYCEDLDSQMRCYVDALDFQRADMPRASFLTGSESVEVCLDLPAR